jgi:hypothetical protein
VSTDPNEPNALDSCALAGVLRWPWRRHLAVLREDSLVGPFGPKELERRIALSALDLAAREVGAPGLVELVEEDRRSTSS